LNKIKDKGIYPEQLRSEYIAVTDPELCIGCGVCESSCFFAARQAENGKIQLTYEKCFGCGKCVEACPRKAILLVRKKGRGMEVEEMAEKCN
jgi:heterodisulfide reductase subunit A-like polyferredoxin